MLKNKLAKDWLFVVFLIILTIGILWLGFSNINSKINIKKNNSNNIVKQDNTVDDNSIIHLKIIDTDYDGLNDYDEINVYHTSIYLADTDSDGFSDKEEVDTNNDPLCPRGKNCSFTDKENSSTVDKTKEIILNNYIRTDLTNNQTNSIDNKILSGQATVDEVKTLLIEQGMSSADLVKITDTEIMKMYNDLLTNINNSQ